MKFIRKFTRNEVTSPLLYVYGMLDCLVWLCRSFDFISFVCCIFWFCSIEYLKTVSWDRNGVLFEQTKNVIRIHSYCIHCILRFNLEQTFKLSSSRSICYWHTKYFPCIQMIPLPLSILNWSLTFIAASFVL